MRFKTDKRLDYKINKDSIRNTYRKVVSVPVKETVDTSTGEVDSKSSITLNTLIQKDIQTFVKLYRMNILLKLSKAEMDMVAYFMCKVNRFGRAEMNWQEYEAFSGGRAYSSYLQFVLDSLQEKSIVTKEGSHMYRIDELCFAKVPTEKLKQSGFQSQDYKHYRFIKIYDPTIFLKIGLEARKVLAYILFKMQFNGIIEFSYEECKSYCGYKTSVSIAYGKRELLSLDIMKDLREIARVMDDKKKKIQYYRINPNYFFKGDRLDNYNVNDK